MALRVTRALRLDGRGWRTHDPRDHTTAVYKGLHCVRELAKDIQKMADKAIATGDAGEQVRALALSYHKAQDITTRLQDAFEDEAADFTATLTKK